MNAKGILILTTGLIVAGSVLHINAQTPSKPSTNRDIRKWANDVSRELRKLRGDVDVLLQSETCDDELVGILEEYAEAVTGVHRKIKPLWKTGEIGGEAENEAVARYEMCAAKAEVAIAKGNMREAEKQYEAAIKASEDAVKTMRTAYEVNVIPVDRVLRANRKRAEAKLKLSRLRKKDHLRKSR